MKRILGIILAVLSCVAFFVFLVWKQVVAGCTIGDSILIVLFAIVTALTIAGLMYLISWLLLS